MDATKYFLVDEQSLKRLIQDSMRLESLKNYGVDNWAGHGEDLKAFFDTNDAEQIEELFDSIADSKVREFRNTNQTDSWELDDVANDHLDKVFKAFIKDLKGRGELNLQAHGINAYQAKEYFEKNGYECGEMDINGWEMDFWIPFTKDDAVELVVAGTGMTGSCILIADPDNEDDEDVE